MFLFINEGLEMQKNDVLRKAREMRAYEIGTSSPKLLEIGLHLGRA